MSVVREVFGGDSFVDLVDVFFNGRREPEKDPRPKIQFSDLVERGTSVVKSKGKLYKVTVTEVDLSKL